MDFALTEDQRLFVDNFCRFLTTEVEPLVPKAERDHRMPVELFGRFGSLGYLGLPFSEEDGGLGLGYQSFCLFAEELGRVCSGIAGSILSHMSIGILPITLLGADALKARLLPAAIAGDKIGAFALTEPGAGTDAAAIKTRAVKVDGGYVLNGQKTFITNGPFADFACVAAQTAPEKSYRGITLFVVEKGAKGFTQGKALPKLGKHSSECGEMFFEDCFVPDEHRLGEEGDGFKAMMESLNNGRMVVGAHAVGIARAAFEACISYARERHQFGKPIGSFQLIQAKLARMKVEIDAARLLCWRAAWLHDQGRSCALEASIAKLKASEVAVEVTGDAIQLFGGWGYMQEYPVERYWRDAKGMTIVEGTSEIQQIIIARSVLA